MLAQSSLVEAGAVLLHCPRFKRLVYEEKPNQYFQDTI